MILTLKKAGIEIEIETGIEIEMGVGMETEVMIEVMIEAVSVRQWDLMTVLEAVSGAASLWGSMWICCSGTLLK